MVSHEESVESWVGAYSANFSEILSHTNSIGSSILARLKDDGLNYHQVSERAKKPDSLRKKLLKTVDGKPKYPTGLKQIDDIIGIRVITFLRSDIDTVVAALSGKFICLEDTDKTEQTKGSGTIGYGGRHLVLQVPQDDAPEGCGNCKGQRFEVQIRTVLQHAWAEFEHDVRYKGSRPVPLRANRSFTMAATLIDLADAQFTSIQDLLLDLESENQGDEPEQTDANESKLTGEEVLEVLQRFLPDHPRSKAEHYSWLAELAVANGVGTRSEAERLFESANWHDISQKMDYQFPAGHVRIADDLMLQKWGEEYIERTASLSEDPQRTGKLRHRLRRLQSTD